MRPSIRPAAVAGTFYTSSSDDLASHVRRYLEAQPPREAPTEQPKALIVPHAGYEYSGPVAGSAYRLLAPFADRINKVVLLGPCHRVAVRGLALSGADRFATPLGEVALDTEAAKRLSRLPFVEYSDKAHAQEHSLEVQLPFLQMVLGSFTLLPIACGQASDGEVEAVLREVWGGPETLILVSSDLSHFHDYQTAQRLDQASTRAIEGLEAQELAHESACGLIPVRGLLRAAQDRGLRATTLDLRNSGDTAGPRDRVVGYGAYCFV